MPSTKLGEFTGVRQGGSLSLAGIQVEIWDQTRNRREMITTTDINGRYGFQKLHPMCKYYVIFTYDGMRFECTKYTNNLAGKYSTAQEWTRGSFNSQFSKINSTPANYGGKRAYGLYTKLVNGSDDYISYSNSGVNAGALRYFDALEKFKEITTNKRTMDPTNKASMDKTYYSRVQKKDTKDEGYDSYSGTFTGALTGMGASGSEASSVWGYMKDTFISAKTIAYPEEDKFVIENVDTLPASGNELGFEFLYIRSRDQSRNVDFGLKLRTNADLWLSKDLYKTTMLINGKRQEYYYDKKTSETDAEGNWTLNLSTGMYEFSAGSDGQNRAGNSNYTGERYGGSTYTREVRKSEYLYDGSDSGTVDAKNLQVFVTYKIAVKNQAQDVPTSVDEIVDYYDSDQYTYDGSSTIIKDNTFIGDKRGNKSHDLNVSTSASCGTGYTIDGTNDYEALYLTGMGTLSPGEITYVYLTFKVNNDNAGKVKLDQVMDDLLNWSEGKSIRDTVGKRNIAEINGYSTAIGVIDLDSNPGSLRPKDLDSDGNIISSSNEAVNRLEDDTDKAGNLRLKISTVEETRSFSGYVYEDARTEVSDGAVIGNGKYNVADVDFEGNRDKKINGVTIQLVELVQIVDGEGFSTGNYEKERIWSSYSYQKNNNSWGLVEDASRYYSGTNSSKVILSGQGVFKVNPVELTGGDGQYRFDSLPPGDFIIRFIYGDTTQTVLTNVTDGSDEVQNLFNTLNDTQKNQFVTSSTNAGILGTSGLNSKTYTGQDYKTTIYQRGVNQNASVNYHTYIGKNEEITKNGVVGYTDTVKQNYGIQNQDSNPNTNENLTVADKEKMYNYSISESSKIENTISDAKDVYSYREKEKAYSMGSTSSILSENQPTLKNHRAEVLASGTELLTKTAIDLNKNMIDSAVGYQKSAIEELMNNTAMTAQTGVINSEVEYDRKTTLVYDPDTKQYVQKLDYHLQDVNLGLTERPRAQLNVSKELTNMQIKLANGQILFDAHQSVSNLIYQQHKNYDEDEYYIKVEDRGNVGYRLRESLRKVVESRQEELVQATMDEELMSGATIRLTYKISVNNIGEVDYLDTNFYYLGKTNDNSKAETNWRNVVKTNAMNVLDYVSNEVNYEENYQDDSTNWKIVTADVLLGTTEDKSKVGTANYNPEDNDYVNDSYRANLDTFNVLITTNKLSEYLIPRAIDPDKENYSNSRREVSLILSTLLANTIANKNLIFTNMAELIEVQNTFGRRMHLSRVGNQYVPYQSEEKDEDESTYWIEPKEPDEDSGQKVVILPPTGENKNVGRAVVLIISALVIITVAVILIKKNVLLKKEQK